MIEAYKSHFANILQEKIGIPVEEILDIIEISPDNIPGDLAFPCFQLAKQAKQSPNILAQQFAEKFSSHIGISQNSYSTSLEKNDVKVSKETFGGLFYMLFKHDRITYYFSVTY